MVTIEFHQSHFIGLLAIVFLAWLIVRTGQSRIWFIRIMSLISACLAPAYIPLHAGIHLVFPALSALFSHNEMTVGLATLSMVLNYLIARKFYNLLSRQRAY
jgi:hypothetical protein